MTAPDGRPAYVPIVMPLGPARCMGLVPPDQPMLRPGKGNMPACTVHPAGPTPAAGPPKSQNGPWAAPPPKKLPNLEAVD